MNLLSVDTPVDPTITGLNSNNVLEIENPVDVVVSGDQENLTIQKSNHSKITVYLEEPQTIIIQKSPDTKETLQV